MSTFTFVCNNIASLILNDKEAAQKVRNAVTQNKVNWARVIEFSSGWLVLPTLFDNLQKQQLWTEIPEDIYLYLKTIHELSEERTIKTQEDIRKVHAYFTKNNIPAVAIKGASYHINKLYSGTTFRIESDIDLLIPDNFLTLSYSLLKDNGFSAQKEYEEKWEKRPVAHHLPPLLNKSGTEVEIHQFLYLYNVPILLTSAEVWNKAIQYDKLLHSPSPTHMIMLILIHSMIVGHSYCLRTLNLRTVQDTLFIRKQYEDKINWEFIERRFKAAHLSHIPSAYFQSIEYFFGMPAPVVYKRTWRTAVYIQKIRLNVWLRHSIPRLYTFISPFRRRYCYEKSIIGKLVIDYWIRIQNKLNQKFPKKTKLQ